MRHLQAPVAPPAQLTLRAHAAAPARVELLCNPAGRRALQSAAWLVLFWGAIPFLLWVPPHYPWAAAALISGAYLSYRSWTGRYTIRSFAGICPRCGSPLALGVDRTVDLPHTLTCFSCHFEPTLEVAFLSHKDQHAADLTHQLPDCTGTWRIRWLADEQFMYCEECHAGTVATPAVRAAADRDAEVSELLDRLTDEGKPLI